MNHPASLFRDLSSAWHLDAAGERVDALAAELAAHAARAGTLCLGLIEPEAVPRFYGLVFLLDSYGLTLRKRYRQRGDAVFVFVEPKGSAAASEFAGAVVRECAVPAPVPALARAA